MCPKWKKIHITRLNGTNIFEFDLVNLFGSELYQFTIVAQVGKYGPWTSCIKCVVVCYSSADIKLINIYSYALFFTFNREKIATLIELFLQNSLL